MDLAGDSNIVTESVHLVLSQLRRLVVLLISSNIDLPFFSWTMQVLRLAEFVLYSERWVAPVLNFTNCVRYETITSEQKYNRYAGFYMRCSSNNTENSIVQME